MAKRQVVVIISYNPFCVLISGLSYMEGSVYCDNVKSGLLAIQLDRIFLARNQVVFFFLHQSRLSACLC